jgi:hypothetical protein
LAPEGYPAYGGPAGAVNLYAEIEPNTTGEERTATITIYDGTKQTIYHIIQSGTTKNGGFPMPYEPDPAGHDVMLMTPDGHGWLFAGAVQSPGIPDGMGPDPDGISYRRGLNGVKAGRFVFLRAVPHAGYEPPTWRVETAEGQQEIYLHLQEMDLDGELFAFFEMPDEAVTVQAMFLPTPPPTYTITVTAVGRGTAWAGYTETEAGTLVELRATANTDYEFVEWRSTDGNPIPFDGSWDKDDEYCYLVMPSRNVSVEAVFAPAAGTQDYNDITVTMTREGGVSAFASLDAGATSGVTTLTAKEDDVVYLTAAAQEGYTFAGWHGIGNFVSPDGESYNPSAIVMRRKEVNMKATFVPTGATSFIRRWGWLTGYIEITGNSFRSHGTYFLHEVFIKDVVWTPITGDAEYPTGYKISGTLIECFNYTTPAADVGSGENYVCIFLAADGKSIRVWDNFNYPGEIAPNGHVAR